MKALRDAVSRTIVDQLRGARKNIIDLTFLISFMLSGT